MYEQARAAADHATAAWAAGEPAGQLDRRAGHHQGSGLRRRACRRSAARPPTRISCRSVDAAVVSALKSAGAIVTCKTTTCESGYKLTADSPVSGHHPQSLEP